MAGWHGSGYRLDDALTNLFFTIWAATQTYADFDAQVCAVLGVQRLDDAQQARATAHGMALILRGCGLSG